MPYTPLTREQYESLRSRHSPQKIIEMERVRKQREGTGPFKYNVPETRQAKRQRIAESDAEFQREARQANSVGGFLGNFGGAVTKSIFPSEVGLGETVRKTFLNQGDTYTSAITNLTKVQADTARRIREMKAAGKDTSKLEGLYNENQDRLASLSRGLSEETSLPSTLQVAGQLGGTALDVLTAGTYGQRTAGMRTGQLGSRLPTATRVIRPITPTGLFTGQTLGRATAGGAIGYGYDVVGGLQGNRGEDRTGAGAFIPGLGTAVGIGVPLAIGAYQSVNNAITMGAQRKAQSKLDVALDLTQPRLTETQKAEAIARGRLKNPTLVGKGRLYPTAHENEVAESVSHLVKKGPVSDNVDAIRQEVTRINMGVRDMIADRKVPFNLNQLRSRLQAGNNELRLVFASEPTAKRTYAAVVQEFMRHLDGGDTLGLFDARQDFDQVPAIRKLLENDKLGENVRREIVFAVRRAANEYISELLGKNNPYAPFMRKESLMLEALGNIGLNNTSLIGRNQIQLFAENFPILKYFVGGAIGAAGVGVGGAAIGSL